MTLKSMIQVTLVLAFTMIGFVSCNAPSDEQEAVVPSTASTPNPYPTFQPTEFHGEKNFAHLINRYSIGKPDPTPWAGYWWPYTGNGIAAGTWGGGGASPAGKYDAARGRTTNSQGWEIQLHGPGVPGVQGWWGHCNGWCAAAALLPEPRMPSVVNGVEFGIADIKALASEAGMSVYADYFGERVDLDDSNSAKYWDVVPDQYFLVLTNYMGKMKRTVLIDRYTGHEVWNQPLAGYQIEYPTRADYLGASPEAPNVYRIELTSTLWWMNDNVEPGVLTPEFVFQTSDLVDSRTLRMEVWLDGPVVFDDSGRITSSGDVIVTREGNLVAGGAWQMGDGYMVDAWPDYMWIPYSFLKPQDPDQDNINPEVDIDWLKKHVLVEGGMDDLSVLGVPVEIAPPVTRPSSVPSPLPTPNFTSFPTPGLTPDPMPQPSVTPDPMASPNWPA